LKILGISAFYHDSAVALLNDGKILFAAQEERFTRKKHDADFPILAAKEALRYSGLSWQDIDYVAFYDKPFLKFERLLETYVAYAPRGFLSFQKSIPLWVKEKLFQKDLIQKKIQEACPDLDLKNKLLFSEHHLSHAASAFFPSPFNEAAVLTMDGVGEWTTTSIGVGRGNKLEIQREIHFPHSLGLLYSAFTYYSGFKVNSGEYKLMGLAPYGEPKYANKIYDNLIDLKPDGSFKLNMKYFNYCVGLTMTNQAFHSLFGSEPRNPDAPLRQLDMDLAASVQVVLEEAVLRLTRSIVASTGIINLCLSGGVALNCVANGKILKDGRVKNIWIQPASGDAGGALGAALCAHHLYASGQRTVVKNSDSMQGSYLGQDYNEAEIESQLRTAGARFEKLSDTELFDRSTKDLESKKALGWFQGRMEYGPRALGGRSILGDPRSPKMQSQLNLKIKFRESFRPFAPAVLREKVSEWFELDVDSPYMLLVAGVRAEKRKRPEDKDRALKGIDKLNVPRSEIPAVTHVDFSARVQTVHEKTNPRFHALLEKFYQATGCPVLVNTSFNVRGEPIVCTPADAFRCFMGTNMDSLVVGNFYLRKEDQDSALRLDYSQSFEKD
jgi:carbamoyltransferase